LPFGFPLRKGSFEAGQELASLRQPARLDLKSPFPQRLRCKGEKAKPEIDLSHFVALHKMS